jgi:hypothetical protein
MKKTSSSLLLTGTIALGAVLLSPATHAAQGCDAASAAAQLCFVTPSGYLVEAITGRNGEFPVLDDQGNSVFAYRLTGAAALGGSCTGPDISHASILFPATCVLTPSSVVSAEPMSRLLTGGQGDPSCGFGSGDSSHDVLKWDQDVECGESSVFMLVLAGQVPAVPTSFSVKEGAGCSTATILGPGCPNLVDYCPPNSNSTGVGAIIDYDGTYSIAENNFKLTGAGLPPGNFGYYFYGTIAIQQTFGDGYRCVGGQVTRLKKIAVMVDGTTEVQYDLATPPLNTVVPGVPYYFQLWYRDPQAGGEGFNTSNALAILFTP